MAQSQLEKSYKFDFVRFRHYYSQLYKYASKPPVQVSLALLLTIFTIVFFAIFAIRPTLTTITTLLKEIEEKEVVLEELKKKSASLASAQQTYAQNQEAIDKLNKALPTQPNPKEFLGYIEAIASQLNGTLDTLSAGEYQIPQNNELAEDGIRLLPVSVSITAPYQDLVDTMDQIYNTPRFVTVNSIGLSTSQEGNNQTDSGQPQMVLRLELVSLVEEEL